jgi:hypothetical protein
VTLRGGTSPPQHAVVDGAGRARLGSLPPGTYVLTIRRPNGRGNGAAFESEIVLGPGARETLTIGIPYRTLPIRLPNGEQLEPTARARPPVW